MTPSLQSDDTSRPYVQVAFALPVREMFTYRVPGEFAGQITPGMRVLAPFGNQKLIGVAVALTDEVDPKFKLKSIQDLPDGEPLLTPEMMNLTAWMADYYKSSWGEALRSALPPGLEKVETETYQLTGKGQEALDTYSLGKKELLLLNEISSRKKLSAKQLRTRLKNKFNGLLLSRLVQEEYLRVSPQKQKSSAQFQYKKFARAITGKPKEEIDPLLKRSPKQRELYDLLVKKERPVSELASLVPNYQTALRSLKQKGLAETGDIKTRRTGEGVTGGSERDSAPEFTKEQKSVFSRISKQITSRSGGVALLEGVTGSGKTEVYLAAIQQVLKQDRSALMLVPEISLTPQTVDRFKKRFGDHVAILHSGLTDLERYQEWRKIKDGKVDIAVGARSAVFAPFTDLGLIIIDEEHDASYKQETAPRYHARDTAIMRARANNGLVILGSATPSLESRRNAETGKYIYLQLKHRVEQRLLPTVQLVDMRKERSQRKNFFILSRLLQKAVHHRLERKQQVFLFLNRRGTANYVVCKPCGYVFDCPRCTVSLTFHGKARRLVCHYCNYTAVQPTECADCGGEVIRFSGFGTQKLEEEARKLFPKARIARLDRDTAKSRKVFETLYRDMNAGNIDILIGTQMITKGHDFANVTLVGVVYADMPLHIPDFRSSERAFQLTTQVGGRAGRGAVPGEVILQVHDKEHYVFGFVQRHDYAGFYDKELAFRKRLHYPPFTRLVSIEVESGDEEAAENVSTQLKDVISDRLDGVDLLGPAPAALYRVNEKYRWHLILRAADVKSLSAFMDQLLPLSEFQSTAAKITIDVDPVNML